MNPIRVLIVDDNTLVREGIRAVLRDHGTVEIVGEAREGNEALRLVKKHRPTVVLMDISMPGMTGLEAATRIAEDHPNIPVVVLSNHGDPFHVRQAVRARVAGYVLKEAVPELLTAVQAVAAGKTYFCEAVADFVASGSGGGRTSTHVTELLTPRQREILKLIAQGYSTKQIAQRLTISVKTAESHRTELMNRLDIHDVASLVRYAIRMGLVRPEE